jgi:hypothetical protein
VSTAISIESEVQQLLEAAEKECRQDQSSERFLQSLLEQLRLRMGAVAARVWQVSAVDAPRCTALAGSSGPRSDDQHLTNSVTGVVDCFHIDGVGDGGGVRCLVTSTEVVDELRIVLEVVGGAPGDTQELLVPICDVLADLQRRIALGKLVLQQHSLLRAVDLITLLHSDLNQERILNTIASDLAAVFNMKRVSVCQRLGASRWKLATVTAVTEPDPRADAVRDICSVVGTAEQQAAEIGNAGDAAAGQSSGATQLVRMADGSEAQVRPLNLREGWDGSEWAVVLESEALDRIDQQTLSWVCRHAALSLDNCRRFAESSPLTRLRRTSATLFRKRPLMLLILLIVAVWLLAMPTELRVEAYGKVVPVNRTHVFTPDNGIIEWVGVREGDTVAPGQELFRLRSDAVELQLEEVSGDLAASRAKLAAIESTKGTYNAERNAIVSGEEVELRAMIESLERQKQILEGRRSALTVTSVAAGRVFGDVLREHLEGRPVQRGQFLFDVADPESDWQLDLRVPESEVRHVLSAAESSEEPLAIRFTLETAPESTQQTSLAHIGGSVQIDERGSLSTRVTAPVGETPTLRQRPGAGVIATIECGAYPRAYVYFRKAIEFLRRTLTF